MKEYQVSTVFRDALKIISEKEQKLDNLVARLPVNTKWLIISIGWYLLGIHICTDFLPFSNFYRSVINSSITCAILWQCRDMFLVFFRNPFKAIDKPYVFSSVLWVMPFTIILSALFLESIPESLGWISSDPQNKASMSYDFVGYLKRVSTVPVDVIAEEVFNTIILIVVYKLVSKKIKTGRLITTAILVSLYFGFLHIFGWGYETGILIMFSHIPYLFITLYYRNAWPSVLAHIYLNAIIYTRVVYPDIGKIFFWYGFIFLIVILGTRSIVSRLIISFKIRIMKH